MSADRPTSAEGRSSRLAIPSDRQGFDRRWFAPHLDAVYVPRNDHETVADVTDAIRRYGQDVKAVSGRHCYENFVYNESTRAVIDMSSMNRVGYDESRRAYFVEAGCENWSVYRSLLNGYDRTLPAGSCYSVGAGGHITGGGYGLLSRLHGLTVDHLTGVDIVTWDARARRGRAELRHVSENSACEDERNLFWALRGAGCGNFGVIVRYYFAELPEAPQYASICTFAWDWSTLSESVFAGLLAAYAELVCEMPETDFSLLKLNHISAGQIGMILQAVSEPGMSYDEHCEGVERRRARMKATLEWGAPGATPRIPLRGHPGWMTTAVGGPDVQHVTYLEALQTLNGSGPNQFGKYKSAYMNKAFPAEQAQTIYDWLQRTPRGVPPSDMNQSLLQVDSYGGAINRVSATETAIPQRQSIMKLQYQTYWINATGPGQCPTPESRIQAEAHLRWIDGFYSEMYRDYGGTPDPNEDSTGTVDGAYYNYPDSALGTHADGNVDKALWLYFLNNYRANERNLVAVKRRWDPENFFHQPNRSRCAEPCLRRAAGALYQMDQQQNGPGVMMSLPLLPTR